MYPEDAVLVAYLPTPADFHLLKTQQWYRIRQSHTPKGFYADYIAFYFGARFGEQRYSIRYVARRLGHELVRRKDLLPHQGAHARANDLYYKVQVGPLRECGPIVSRRWRRILFAHTTWDRLQSAREIGELFATDSRYVARNYGLLKENPAIQYQPLAVEPNAVSDMLRFRHAVGQ